MSDRITAEEAQRLLDDGSPGWGARLESAAWALAAEVVALAAERDELQRRLDAVLALHISDGEQNPWCVHDGYSWPCETVRKLGGAS